MRDFQMLLGAALAVVFLALFLAMAVAGIRSGRIATEAKTPPIAFQERPVAFVRVCLFYLTCAGLFAVAAVRCPAGLLAAP